MKHPIIKYLNKNTTIAFLSTFLILLNSSCVKELFNCLKEEGTPETREIDLESFHSLHLEENAIVTFKDGEEQKVEITSTPNVIDAIIENSTIEDEIWTLIIAECNSVEGLEVFITLPELRAVEVDADARILTEGKFKNASNITLASDGDALFEMDFDTLDNIRLTTDGFSQFFISGRSNSCDIQVDGNGTIRNFDLETQDCDITIDGQASCEVTVHHLLRIQSEGDGKICYRGNPTTQLENEGDLLVEDCN